MRSEAATVDAYLEQLPEYRRTAIAAVRDVILENLPDGYEESMSWGMIAYEVPLTTYPDTYNGKPLAYAALASQKNYMALYLTGIYMDEEAREKFERDYRATGKRFDVGKSCVRFRKLEDLPLPVIASAIRYLPAEDFVERVKAIHSPRKAGKSTGA
ncbi:MAG: iron chaperone [Gemmatimonadota bacterium]